MEHVAFKGEKILPVEIMGFLTTVNLFSIANKSISYIRFVFHLHYKSQVRDESPSS